MPRWSVACRGAASRARWQGTIFHDPRRLAHARRTSEEPDDIATADGRPATCEAAYDRLREFDLRRSITLTRDEAKAIAQAVAKAQSRIVAAAWKRCWAGYPKGPEGIVPWRGAASFSHAGHWRT